MNRIRLKVGEKELEIEGDEAFVERQLTRLLPLLTGDGVPAEPIPEEVPASAPPVLRVRRRISLCDLFALKEPRNLLERFMVCAYYLEKYEMKHCWTEEEAEARYREAFPEGPWHPQAWSDAREEAMGIGYVVQEPEGMTLSYSGQTFVQNGLDA